MRRFWSMLLGCIFCGSMFQLGLYGLESFRQVRQLEALRSQQAEHPDLAGWIQIEGTAIDYPVMHTPDRPDYYLYRDWEGNASNYGCIYAEEICDVAAPSDNVTLYGHAMQDGSMFAGLWDYADAGFWEAHPVIRLDTPAQLRSYRIFAVFRTSGYEGVGFPYHAFAWAEQEQDFSDFVAQCKDLSLYDTGITPEYGSKLLCLSTCDYTRANGRFVVAAVLETDMPDG